MKNSVLKLKPGGKLLLEVPINGRLLTGIYKSLQRKYNGYDEINSRQSHYKHQEVFDKVKEAGMHIVEHKFTYGTFGKLAHELFNITLVLFLNDSTLMKLFSIVLFYAFLPFLLVFNCIDYCTTHKEGNGLIVVAEKPIG